MKQFFIILITAILSAFLAVFVYKIIEAPKNTAIVEASPQQYASLKKEILEEIEPRAFLSSSPTDFINASDKVRPAVVNIKSISTSDETDWLGRGANLATGSGVIISKDGYIITNHHVIEGAKDIEVRLLDKRSFDATLVSSDPSTDLALLLIKGEKLPYVRFGNSDSLQVGEWVLAIGSPFDLESTVTAGIVSAKGRSIDILDSQDRIESFIQTDAVVNPGNSGGALVNTNGELIGINTAIISHSGGYEGYSFAVPSNLAQKVIRDLKEYGEVQRGLLGVFVKEVDNDMATNLSLPYVGGVFVDRVSPGGGADDAGLQSGDVILSINGRKIESVPQMQEQIGRYRPGYQISVDYIRDAEIQSCKVTLKNKRNDTRLLASSDSRILKKMGFEVRNLSKQERKSMGEQGVRVLSIYKGGIIERTNMDPGFIITHVNDQQINNVDDLLNEIQDAEEKVVLEGQYDNYPGAYYYAFSK